MRDFAVIVVNNGPAAVVPSGAERVINNTANLGFGAAVNQGIRASDSEFVLALNDDATLAPDCLAELLDAAARYPQAGMFAPAILLDPDTLDSAGMRIARDASSKQRGHRAAPDAFATPEEALLPSGCAALYRRSMLDDVGLFDESFFLYCEDTDLGLRARWRGWICRYVPTARVAHQYSHSAGRASSLKAYLAERNRLFLAVKNFPARDLFMVPFAALARYFWHAAYLPRGQGKAAEHGNPLGLVWVIVKAHLALIAALPRLIAQRRQTQTGDRAAFRRALTQHRISLREVAAQ